MSNTVKKMIERVDYFACGYCTNDLKRVFKGFDKTIVNFYAGVFLIKHKKLGYILYDTGYSMDILKNNLKIQISKNVNSPPIVAINIRTVKINSSILSPHNILILGRLLLISLSSTSSK